METVDYGDLILRDLNKICGRTIKLGYGIDIPIIIRDLTSYWAALPLMLVFTAFDFLKARELNIMNTSKDEEHLNLMTDKFFNLSETLLEEAGEANILNNLCKYFDRPRSKYRIIYIYPSLTNIEDLLLKMHRDKHNLILLFPTEELCKNIGDCSFLSDMIFSEFLMDPDFHILFSFLEEPDKSSSDENCDQIMVEKITRLKREFINKLENRLRSINFKYEIFEIKDIVNRIPHNEVQQFIAYWTKIRDYIIKTIEAAYDDELTYIDFSFRQYLNRMRRRKIVERYSLQILHTKLYDNMAPHEYRNTIIGIGGTIERFLKEYYGFKDDKKFIEMVEELKIRKEVDKTDYDELRHLIRILNSAKHDPYFEADMEITMSIYYIAERILKKYRRKHNIKPIT